MAFKEVTFTILQRTRSRKEVGERTANPLSLTETCHPSHLASWGSVITALSQPCHHKHSSPDWAGADGERDRACVAMLGCQFTRLMQGLLRRTQKCLFQQSQISKLNWHLCPRREGAENWYAMIFLWPEWSNCYQSRLWPFSLGTVELCSLRIWKHRYKHCHTTVHTSLWHLRFVFVSDLVTADHDLTTIHSTNKMTMLIRVSGRGLMKLLHQISALGQADTLSPIRC